MGAIYGAVFICRMVTVTSPKQWPNRPKTNKVIGWDCGSNTAMSSTSSDFKFSCNISFFRITTILSWRYAYSLIRLNIRRQYRACPCHLFCSVVLVNIIILLWCWAYRNPTDYIGTTPYWNLVHSACFEVCMWHTKKVIVIFFCDYGASTLLQILHQSFFSFINGKTDPHTQLISKPLFLVMTHISSVLYS